MKVRTDGSQIQALALRLMDAWTPVPDGKFGTHRVTSRTAQPGEKLMVVSFREAMFSGLPPTDVILEKPYVIQELNGPTGTWMTNQPCELVQMHRDFCRHARGPVLLGGLGLGVAGQLLSRKRSVREIAIVEKSRDVIRLVGQTVPKADVIKADLFDFCRTLEPGRYSAALLDIWQGTGEWVWQTEVVPLRRLTAGKIQRVSCWQEQVMQGQVIQGIFRAADTDLDLMPESNFHMRAFRLAVQESFLVDRNVPRLTRSSCTTKDIFNVEAENREDPAIRFLAWTFLNEIGLPHWERIFGDHWDGCRRDYDAYIRRLRRKVKIDPGPSVQLEDLLQDGGEGQKEPAGAASAA